MQTRKVKATRSYAIIGNNESQRDSCSGKKEGVFHALASDKEFYPPGTIIKDTIIPSPDEPLTAKVVTLYIHVLLGYPVEEFIKSAIVALPPPLTVLKPYIGNENA